MIGVVIVRSGFAGAHNEKRPSSTGLEGRLREDRWVSRPAYARAPPSLLSLLNSGRAVENGMG